MPSGTPPIVDTVVKLGGGVLGRIDQFDAALAAIGAVARGARLLIVPGGGPFADTVREVDRRLGLSDDAAHWMAVSAMDQYAWLVATKLPNGIVVTNATEIAGALVGGKVPVLAPSRWLRDVDPLPHTWDVTSDSIAAWVAGRVGATRLVLVKPSGATGNGIVDAYFDRALPGGVTAAIVPADRIDELVRSVRL